MKVAITAPSLNTHDNVSGISTIVTSIITYNKNVDYIHLMAGGSDTVRSRYKRMYSILLSYRRAVSLLMYNGFDLLHLNLALNSRAIFRDLITFVIFKRFHTTVIVHLHGGQYLQKKPPVVVRKVIRYMLSAADKVIVLSDIEKESIETIYGVIGSKVLPNAVDTNVFRRTNSDKRSKKLKFLFMGRLHESKGLKIILEAFEILSKQVHNIELVICGNGPLRDLVIEKQERKCNIKYFGTISGTSKIQVMNDCDVFLLPSLYGEGLPMALLEAMACGLTPIVSTDGSMRYVVENGINGFFVKKNCVDDLVKKIQNVLQKPSCLRQTSSNAISTVVNSFDIYEYLNILNDCYGNIPADTEEYSYTMG